MFNKSDLSRNECMLKGKFSRQGYDWWWHSFTAQDKNGNDVPFFVEYFLCNPALAEDEPVLGQDPANREQGKRPSYLMVKCGCWGKNKKQLHRFFSWNDVDVSYHAPYFVQADDCFASDNAISGRVEVTPEQSANPGYMSDAGVMEWDLTLEKKVAFNVGYGAGKLFRDLKAFEMYWHAEGIKTLVSGTITLDGETYTVTPEKSYGYSDKNWGSNFTSPWVWLSSCCLKSNITGKVLENSVFDIGGGRPKAFGIALDRKLLSAMWYEGKAYEFNFSKFWTHTKTTFQSHETDSEIVWNVEQSNRNALMRTEIHCKKEDMLFVNYEDPCGNKKYSRLWNGGNGWGNVKLYSKVGNELTLIDDIACTHVGCEYGEFDS